jgi:hypothetical protein
MTCSFLPAVLPQDAESKARANKQNRATLLQGVLKDPSLCVRRNEKDNRTLFSFGYTPFYPTISR